MSHSYRTILDAKFEFGTFSTFGDMTHKLSLSKREQVIKFVYLPPGNGFQFFYVHGRSLQPKIDPLSISAISKQKKSLHFQNF